MSIWSHSETALALGYTVKKSILFPFMSLSVLVQHHCHCISVTLMENIRDALLMFPPLDITALSLPSTLSLSFSSSFLTTQTQ